jgi:hypothetical protein
LAASTVFASGFAPDRWQMQTNANQACTISRQATGDSTNLPFIQYAMRVQRNSGQTGTGAMTIAQSFESINSVAFAGKTITFSFYARAGADYSPTSSALVARVAQGTGTDQNVFNGLTSETFVINQTSTLTTTWQRFTYTASVAATTTQLATYFNWTPTGTASTNDYFEVTGVQIDIGNVALPFRTNGGTIQGELAACQRYYFRATAGSTFDEFANSFNGTTTQATGFVSFPVEMRTLPTALEQSGTANQYNIVHSSGGAFARTDCSAVPNFETASRYGSRIAFTVASGLTAGGGSVLGNGNNSTAYLGWSAEL